MLGTQERSVKSKRINSSSEKKVDKIEEARRRRALVLEQRSRRADLSKVRQNSETSVKN
jgi:hypothetical protein